MPVTNLLMWQYVPDVVLFVLRGLGHVGSFRLAAEGERLACRRSTSMPFQPSTGSASPAGPDPGPQRPPPPLYRCSVLLFSSLTLTFVVTALARDVPPPPLACGFKAGDQALVSFLLARASSRRHELGLECAVQVQYFSETKQRWVETLVLRMFELDPAVRWHAVLPRMWLISA